MNKRENSQPSLAVSEDEIELSAWMKKALEGDSKSYRLLLTKVNQLMRPYIAHTFNKFGLAASGGQEDVVQEILLAIHLKRATYDPQLFFLPWMYAIARYKAIDYLRRNRSALKNVALEEASEVPSDELEFGSARDLEVLLKGLNEKQRLLIRLVKLQGLTVEEAALQSGFSQSDVKVTLHRALKELRETNENR